MTTQTHGGIAQLMANIQATCGLEGDSGMQSIIPLLMLAMLFGGVMLFRASRVVTLVVLHGEWQPRYVSHGLRSAALFCYWCFSVSFGTFISPCIFVASGRYHVGLWYWLGLFASLGFYAHWVVRDVRAIAGEKRAMQCA